MSSFLEAYGTTQTLALEQGVVFNGVDADIAGTGIAIGADNATFTIDRTGLYNVEWDVNVMDTGLTDAVFGLVEGDELESGASGVVPGRISSGALMNITAVPHTFRLACFTDGAELGEAANAENTAASIRILRFADGAG